MVKINKIQQAILRLDGGVFQELMNAYLFKKYKFSNITCLGSKVGSTKTTKGIPDSYIELKNGKYILIMYGAVEAKTFSKLKKDIEDAYNKDKSHIDEIKIEEVICCYTTNNINIAQREELKTLFKNKNVTLIGIDDMSYDIANNFQSLAKTYLDVSADSGQFCDIEEFIEKHDKSSINAPINIEFVDRKEKSEIYNYLNNENLLLLIGRAGIGKTKLALEVCKEYITQNKTVKCLCIKNNGNDIYEDLIDYVENDNNYLIFIDDINEMHRIKSFMEFIKDKKETCNIKILATVRDYALENVIYKLEEYCTPKIYIIDSMEEDQIKHILENTFKITNSYYQEKIISIANGNPRLAVLAAKGLVENKIKNLNSVLDIFQSYYFPMIKDNNLNIVELKVLFLISLLGPINLDDDNIIEIINKFELTNSNFIENVKKLNRVELLDYFVGKATKISDQNFGNYIVYKVLIEDKIIRLSDLIEKLYPKCILKIINSINMIYSIFYSQETQEYLESEIKKVWSKEPYSLDSRFLYHFYNIDRSKSLKILKEEIKDSDSKKIDLSKFSFNEKKNNQRIDDKKIEILTNFKYGEFTNEAIELLIKYYEKRPDLIMDFYFGFTLNLGIDENSLKNNFSSEINLIKILMERIRANDIQQYNLAYLLIKIIENFLELDHYITKQSRKKLVINLIRVNFYACEALFNFRRIIFNALGELYKITNIKEMVEDLLIKYNIYPLDNNNKKIFENDFKVINNNLFQNWETPNFVQCEILKNFETKYKKIGKETPKSLGFYKNNKQYVIFNNLTFQRELAEDWKKAEQERKNRVIDMIKDFEVDDYSRLFTICSMAEKYKKRFNSFNINSSILDLFNYVLNYKYDMSLKVLKAFLKQNAPFIDYPDILIRKLLEKFNNQDILSVIEENSNNKKTCFLNGYYNNIEKITDKDINNIFVLLHEQVNNKEIYVIDIRNLLKYEKVKKGTLEKYCTELLNLYKPKTNIIYNFLYGINFLEQNDIEYIIDSFENIDTFENLYILCLNSLIDNNGRLGIAILKKDNNFIYKLVTNINNFKRSSSNLIDIFNEIWKLDNYNYYIDIAFNEINKHYFNYFEIEDLFISENKVDENIMLRKIKWIDKYIHENYEDLEKMIDIFDVINAAFINKKKKFILTYIKLNKNVKDFKKIPLFSRLSLWSGSEIPLIDKKINFLEDLYNSINGLDYIEHKDYIMSMIDDLKQYRINIRIREYLEEYL